LSSSKAVTVFPGGFPYDALNGRGHIHPKGMMMMLERARIASWFNDDFSFMEMDKLNSLIYMVSASLNVDNRVYSYNISKQPITINTEVIHLGKTSFNLKADIYFPDDKTPLVSGETQCVLVDPETKRPSQPPEWWDKVLRNDMMTSGKACRPKDVCLPVDISIHEEEIKVLPSDTDFYMHARSANYVDFCLNSYIQWHIKQYGFESRGNPFRTVKSMIQSFKGEADIGDVLQVKFWQNVIHSNMFHFHIFKNNSLINECSIEFFVDRNEYSS